MWIGLVWLWYGRFVLLSVSSFKYNCNFSSTNDHTFPFKSSYMHLQVAPLHSLTAHTVWRQTANPLTRFNSILNLSYLFDLWRFGWSSIDFITIEDKSERLCRLGLHKSRLQVCGDYYYCTKSDAGCDASQYKLRTNSVTLLYIVILLGSNVICLVWLYFYIFSIK